MMTATPRPAVAGQRTIRRVWAALSAASRDTAAGRLAIVNEAHTAARLGIKLSSLHRSVGELAVRGYVTRLMAFPIAGTDMAVYRIDLPFIVCEVR